MIPKLYNCFNYILDIEVLSRDPVIWPQDPCDDKTSGSTDLEYIILYFVGLFVADLCHICKIFHHDIIMLY